MTLVLFIAFNQWAEVSCDELVLTSLRFELVWRFNQHVKLLYLSYGYFLILIAFGWITVKALINLSLY